jgi:hypothetical protein
VFDAVDAPDPMLGDVVKNFTTSAKAEETLRGQLQSEKGLGRDSKFDCHSPTAILPSLWLSPKKNDSEM